MDAHLLYGNIAARRIGVPLDGDGNLAALHAAGAGGLEGVDRAFSRRVGINYHGAGIPLPFPAAHTVLIGRFAKIYRIVFRRKGDRLIRPGVARIRFVVIGGGNDGHNGGFCVEVVIYKRCFLRPACMVGHTEGIGPVFGHEIAVCVGIGNINGFAAILAHLHLGHAGGDVGGGDGDPIFLQVIRGIASGSDFGIVLIDLDFFAHRYGVGHLPLLVFKVYRNIPRGAFADGQAARIFAG